MMTFSALSGRLPMDMIPPSIVVFYLLKCIIGTFLSIHAWYACSEQLIIKSLPLSVCSISFMQSSSSARSSTSSSRSRGRRCTSSCYERIERVANQATGAFSERAFSFVLASYGCPFYWRTYPGQASVKHCSAATCRLRYQGWSTSCPDSRKYEKRRRSIIDSWFG